MRIGYWVVLLLALLPAVGRADSYSLITFDDQPPTPPLIYDPPQRGLEAVTVVYPGVTFSGGAIAPVDATYFGLGFPYTPAQLTPPYHNSYQAALFEQYEVSPGPTIFMTFSTPLHEIDFDFFSENFVQPETYIDVGNSKGENVANCGLGYGLQESFTSGHFDCKGDDITSVYFDGGEPGPYLGVDNVELNAYLKPTATTPEPASVTLIGTGSLMAGFLWRARRRAGQKVTANR